MKNLIYLKTLFLPIIFLNLFCGIIKAQENQTLGKYLLYKGQGIEIRSESEDGMFYSESAITKAWSNIDFVKYGDDDTKIEVNIDFFNTLLNSIKNNTEILEKTNYIDVRNFVRTESGENFLLSDPKVRATDFKYQKGKIYNQEFDINCFRCFESCHISVNNLKDFERDKEVAESKARETKAKHEQMIQPYAKLAYGRHSKMGMPGNYKTREYSNMGMIATILPAKDALLGKTFLFQPNSLTKLNKATNPEAIAIGSYLSFEDNKLIEQCGDVKIEIEIEYNSWSYEFEDKVFFQKRSYGIVYDEENILLIEWIKNGSSQFLSYGQLTEVNKTEIPSIENDANSYRELILAHADAFEQKTVNPSGIKLNVEGLYYPELISSVFYGQFENTTMVDNQYGQKFANLHHYYIASYGYRLKPPFKENTTVVIMDHVTETTNKYGSVTDRKVETSNIRMENRFVEKFRENINREGFICCLLSQWLSSDVEKLFRRYPASNKVHKQLLENIYLYSIGAEPIDKLE